MEDYTTSLLRMMADDLEDFDFASMVSNSWLDAITEDSAIRRSVGMSRIEACYDFKTVLPERGHRPHGDLLVGFIASDRPIEAFDIVVGGETMRVGGMEPHTFRYAVHGCSVLPVCLFRDVKISRHHDLPHFLYAFLPAESRRALVSTFAWSRLPDGMMVSYGQRTMRTTRRGKTATKIELPDMRPVPPEVPPSLALMMRLARERTDVLRDELMAHAWHPDRFRRWCLEYDDEHCELLRASVVANP